jgi:polar amino acid transport system ATP-binding protein
MSNASKIEGTASVWAPAPPNVVVRATNVEKWFGSHCVLQGVSLDVLRGEVVCIIGPSGSGKTTFLRCLNHLEAIEAGVIEVNGALMGYRQDRHGRLVEDSEREICRKRMEIGFVFQRFNLWPHKTALDNIIEAPIRVRGVHREQAVATAEALLARVGLSEKRDAYPNRLSARVGGRRDDDGRGDARDGLCPRSRGPGGDDG